MALFEGRGTTFGHLYRFFYFSLAFVVMAVSLNVIFLYYPLLNLPRSSIKEYINDGNGRAWAISAGLLCGFGNGLQFVGGQAAGYAAADAVQVCSYAVFQ